LPAEVEWRLWLQMLYRGAGALWGVRHPKKVKGEYQTYIIATSDVGISYFQAAVKCTKRCVKSHKTVHETPNNRLRLGLRLRPRWGSL